MPLQKLQLKAGVNRESTTLANEGGYFDSNNIRFRSGSPEKLGGWITDTGKTTSVLAPPVNPAPLNQASFWGVCRSLFAWITLSSANLLGLGTNLKYYIQQGAGGSFYDITPIRQTTAAGDVTFAATNGSKVITITDAAHGAQANDFVTYSGAVSLGGVITSSILNAEFQVVTVLSNNSYTVLSSIAANVSDVGNGGSSVIGVYQVTTGKDVYTENVGWGAGGWGGVTTGFPSTGWGSPAPAGLGIGSQLRLWSQENFGENLILNPRGGALYIWTVASPATIYNRAQLLGPGAVITTTSGNVTTDGSCPTIANFVRVSDSSRFVFAYGCNDYGASTQIPMLIRWSDQESFATWLPSATNQAGSFTLSQGSTIVTAVQTRQETLVITDTAIYSQQYLGAPFVWGFQIMGDNISIMGPNAAVTSNNITYWMGKDKFYMYSGRVETLPCTVRQYIFDDINMSQSYQFFAGTNEGFNEVWWFYCSMSGPSGTGTDAAPNTIVDRYIIYNYLERTWVYGGMQRTAWKDSALRAQPMSTGYGGQLIYQETSVDDGTTTPASPIDAYVQSSDFDIGDGHNYGFVWQLIPDISFNGSAVDKPSATFTIRPRKNPGAAYGADNIPSVTSIQNYQNQHNYNVQQFTEIVYVRARGRQLAFRVGSNTLGVAWQLGTPRINVRPDGRR